jgi:uncharacterized protein DUF1552
MKTLTRRHVLRGAGVALALPWLESLAPRRARGQAVPRPLRFVPIYFPLGSDYPNSLDFWSPATPGQGDAWQLSPLLEPFAPVKSRVSVLGHVDQTAFVSSDGLVAPGNSELTGAFLSCTKVPMGTQSSPTNGVSIDQRIAAVTGARSLQVGLSTLDSYCDGLPCAYSRSISWTADGPAPRLVDPQAVFDAIVGLEASAMPSGASGSAVPGRKSVLDFVVSNATSLEGRLGRSDRARMDEFLTSVRDLETRVAAPTCRPVARPTLSASVGKVPPDYNRDDHANVMVDLMVMALSCDAARVISFMLDDARSDFPYDFLPLRHFTATGSTPAMGNVNISPLVAANAGDGNDMWSTITWWCASKASLLCQKLAAIPDGVDGQSLLDNSVIWFGSGQQGEDYEIKLPLLYVGGGGGALRTNQALSFAPSQRLSNVYLTFLRNVFGATDASFGDSTGVVPQLLA